MELKPVKEREKKLYPTISESKKSNLMKNIVFSMVDITSTKPTGEAIPVAVPSYMQLEILKLVRNVTFITTSIFIFLLIKNKIKMKKDTNQDVEVTRKIKKTY